MLYHPVVYKFALEKRAQMFAHITIVMHREARSRRFRLARNAKVGNCACSQENLGTEFQVPGPFGLGPSDQCDLSSFGVH